MADAGGEDALLAFYTGEIFRLRDGDEDRKRARAAFERSLTHADAPPEAHRSIGLLHWRDGQRHAAAAEFEAYLRLRPGANDRAMIQSYLKHAI
jgi:hypothetical protein